jgi:protein-S-isoprenylcysteine O-methyltransferase Ste14
MIGLVGTALAISGVVGFSRAKTSRVPIRPATSLVTSGPYAFTRNPMYLGLALATGGCGLLLMTWWPMILLIPTLVIIQRFVIVPEEGYLQRRFGADYANYARRIRRWL